jgi:hypothetical protein
VRLLKERALKIERYKQIARLRIRSREKEESESDRRVPV